MQNISWLESLATMTDHDTTAAALLKSQSASIQEAYQANNQSKLKILLGGNELSACKNTIFQL